MKYKVAVSGWATVTVEANSADEAMEMVSDNPPDIAGEIYGLEIHEAVPEQELFKQFTDLD